MIERYPHSIPGWITYIKQNGVSDRPFPEDDSDLINPDIYADPLDTKPERSALASIIAIRAYQRAKKQMLSKANILSQPTIDSIQDLISYSEQIQVFSEKSYKIGMAFDTSMYESLREDEQFILAHNDHPAASVYFRLKNIVDPHYFDFPNEARSSVFRDVYGGVGALPGNMEPLMDRVSQTYLKKHKELPSLKKLAKLMSGSYDKYVQPLASLHKADAEVLVKLLGSAAEHGYIHRFVQLTDDGVQLDPKITKAIRRIENTGGVLSVPNVISPKVNKAIRNVSKGIRRIEKSDGKLRSRTTRCAFLTSAKSIEMFLDEPPDFDEPLQDAFQLYMKLLAA
jgi:hypothetical protein